ncbi:MAG: hypothetical protein Q4D29_12570, partial [Lachnospiraceae bacterium]|nr:hypothetical protein [Lachnospiraceae bacterium]
WSRCNHLDDIIHESIKNNTLNGIDLCDIQLNKFENTSENFGNKYMYFNIKAMEDAFTEILFNAKINRRKSTPITITQFVIKTDDITKKFNDSFLNFLVDLESTFMIKEYMLVQVSNYVDNDPKKVLEINNKIKLVKDYWIKHLNELSYNDDSSDVPFGLTFIMYLFLGMEFIPYCRAYQYDNNTYCFEWNVFIPYYKNKKYRKEYSL